MNALQKLLGFFNTPTNQKMNVICITGIVCTVLCLIDKANALRLILAENWGWWNSLFMELFKTGLPNLLLLVAILLCFIFWRKDTRFRFTLAVPIVMLYQFLVGLRDILFGYIEPVNKFWMVFSLLEAAFLIFCLVFFIIAMIKSDFHQIALIIMAVLVLVFLVNILSVLYYYHNSAVLVAFILESVVFSAPQILFFAGWYMKQKEHTET